MGAWNESLAAIFLYDKMRHFRVPELALADGFAGEFRTNIEKNLVILMLWSKFRTRIGFARSPLLTKTSGRVV
jgi:hypothetical protein